MCLFYSEGSCEYDSTNFHCFSNSNLTKTQCSDAINAYGCKYSMTGCYFDYSDISNPFCRPIDQSMLSSYTCG